MKHNFAGLSRGPCQPVQALNSGPAIYTAGCYTLAGASQLHWTLPGSPGRCAKLHDRVYNTLATQISLALIPPHWPGLMYRYLGLAVKRADGKKGRELRTDKVYQ